MGCGTSKVVVEQPGEGILQNGKPVSAAAAKPIAPVVVIGADEGLNNGEPALATPLVRRPGTEDQPAKKERPELVFMGDSDDEGNETVPPPRNPEGSKAKPERPPLVFMGDSDDEGNETEELPSKNPNPGEGDGKAKPERPPLVFMGDSDDEGNATTNDGA